MQDSLRDEATAALEESIGLDPSNAEALLQLAEVYAEDNLYIQAEIMFERATAYDLVQQRASLGLAQLAIDQFDYPRALTLLREISAQNPERFDLRENIQILENLVTARQN